MKGEKFHYIYFQATETFGVRIQGDHTFHFISTCFSPSVDTNIIHYDFPSGVTVCVCVWNLEFGKYKSICGIIKTLILYELCWC